MSAKLRLALPLLLLPTLSFLIACDEDEQEPAPVPAGPCEPGFTLDGVGRCARWRSLSPDPEANTFQTGALMPLADGRVVVFLERNPPLPGEGELRRRAGRTARRPRTC